ncbi:uncharacterized protein LOC135347001 isoform X2 [Halichondria panicea]|uniref:uncharacterized protein LOC135347001 isoform X2 n=1 Tax=Halichondria panicea TaxID=6063 RepID=UPI00312B3BC9
MDLLVQICLLFYLLSSFVVAEATLDLMYNTSVACPGETVLFTCFVPGGVALQWRVDPPAESMLMSEVQINPFNIFSQVGRRDTFGSGVIMFEAVFVSNDDGNLTSTLINLSEVSVLDGSNVTCVATINNGVAIESQQTVTVAGAPTSPLNPIISSIQNQTLSSIITLDWDSPSSTGGVSVSYALTISPTPLSESPVTVETTLAQITISYDTHYTVTIKTVNCAGNSSAVMVVIPAIVTCPSNPPPADRVTINGRPPLPVLIGSTLSFTCNRQMVLSTCESDGRWSPDPTTYMCLSDLTCGSPAAPSNGSVDVNGGTPPFSLGSEVTYRCEDGLFPLDVRTSTCTDVGGRGEWVENPGSLVCRESPVNCTVPVIPFNGTIVDYELLNETVLEGTVLTYQCDNGLSLTGPNTITCTNAGVWSTAPEEIMCTDIGPIVGGVVGGILVVVCLIGIVVIALFLLKRQKSDEFREDVVEMSGLQGDYSELRHDGPRKESKKAQPPPPDSEGYSRVNRSPDAGALTYDEVVLNSDNKIGINSEGYSTMNTGQTQRLPGYGQLGNVATVEPVVYAALSSSQPHKKGKNTTATVDQHQVTYATVDVAATSRKQAKAATLPTSPTASAPALPDVDKLLDIDQALVQIRSMEHKWRELAETVRLPETMIEQIEDSCGINHSGCLTEVIDQWMRNCSGRPTWRELAGHLHNIGEEQLSQELLNIYNTGRLPVELNMKAVPSTVYKYDRAPPPPLPSRSPTMTDDSPGQSKTLPPSRPPKAEMTPVRPPKPVPKDESPLPPRPPKHYAKH